MDPDYAPLMRGRFVRLLVALTAFVAAWVVAKPARAAEASMLDALASFAPRASTSAPNASADDVSEAPHSPARAETPDGTGAAGARAPLCDRRGAITFAPPPQMQDLEVSLDVGTFDDCESSPAFDRALHRASRGRAPLPVSAEATREPATHASVAPLPRGAFEILPAPAASEVCSRPGFRSTVDRPPRA